MAALKGKKTIAELSQEYGVPEEQILSWKKHFEDHAHELFADKRKKDTKSVDKEIKRLEAIVKQLEREKKFLKEVLN